MIILNFKNFNEMYFSLAKLPFNKYDFYKNYLLKSGSTYYMDNVLVEVSDFYCDIDMSKLNYTISKWTTLKNRYININSYLELKNKLISSNKKTCTFNFRSDVKNHDACIISMVFSRNNPNKEWTNVNIFYRIVDAEKKLACDLILFNRMFSELPNLDIKNIIFHFPKLFFRVEFLTELIGGYFSLDEFTEDNFATNHVKDLWNKYYGEGASLSNYHTVARKQKLKKRSEKLPSIPIESLKIFEGIENNLF